MKFLRLILLLLMLIISLPLFAQQLNWEQVGPSGGVFSTILADANGNTFICDGNLMYKSTNKGADWNLVDVPLFGNEYRSIDKYFIHPSGKIFVFVDNPSDNDSAYCSDLNAKNWNSIEAFPQQINSKGELYGIKPNGTLMISKDDGATWSSLLNFTKSIYNFYLYDDQRFLAVASDSTLITSVDAGKSWKINNLGFGLRDAQIIDDSKNNLYLLSYTRFIKSTDFGNTWEEISFPKTSPFYHVIKNLQEKGIIVGEGNSLYKTMDGGKTWNIEWTFKNLVRDFLVDKTGNYLCSIDTEGLYRFNSFSNSWEKSNRGLFSYVSQINHFGAKLFVSHFSKIFYSPDLGFSWQDVSPSNYFGGTTFHQSGVISAFLIGARIVISSDEGNSWHEINNPVPNSPVVFKTINKEKFLCYSMDKDCMFVSNDAGISWEKTWTYSGKEIWSISNIEIRDEREVYFSIGHNIYKSLDQGRTWQNVQILDYEINNLSISPWGTVYASTSNGIFVSSAGKWSKIPLQTSSSNIFYSEAGIMFINSGAGLYLSSDYGKTFKKAELGLPNTIGKAAIVGGYLFVTRNYLPGIFKAKLEPSKATLFSEGDLVDNYPNPFNSGTVIEFYLKNDGPLELKVYDILGREIETILSKNLTSGFYHNIWQPKNLPSGVYFYRIQTPSFSETKKMIYLK